MTLGIFDLFRIGIGPSSSHTVGPMVAARDFAQRALSLPEEDCARVQVHLYGSLAATGQGHGTPGAILLGLEGATPATVDLDHRDERLAALTSAGSVILMGSRPVRFESADDLIMHPLTLLPRHPNALRLTMSDTSGRVILERVYYSVGGGSIESDSDHPTSDVAVSSPGEALLPYPFSSAEQLLRLCDRDGRSIAQVARANAHARYGETELERGLSDILRTMMSCVATGLRTEGVLPGALGVKRRAPAWYRALRAEDALLAPGSSLDWLNVVALAVNEENAAGGRMVTAPTNGAAGIVPAVLHHAVVFAAPQQRRRWVAEQFLLTAAAIGSLVKERASVSGAEVGCQGEVGSASAMAAAGLTEVLGGSPRQVTNAAEIAMEHNLGLTCDPVAGLVQVPCIERNAVGAVHAMNASMIALRGDGTHLVSLDDVIETMRVTGLDMSDNYKETSRGGLAALQSFDRAGTQTPALTGSDRRPHGRGAVAVNVVDC